MSARTGALPADGIALKPHPTTPDCPLTGLAVQVWRQGDRLSLVYWFEGDLDRVRWPELKPHARADGLWRTTCVEAFIRPKHEDGYVELNFSHSSEWAAYGFQATRIGMRNLGPATVGHWVWPDPEERRVAVAVGLEETFLASRPWRMGLSAVIEALDGSISYWALAHPSDKPDFHHPHSFVLELP